MQPDPNVVMVDQLLRVLLMTGIQAVVYAVVGVIAWRLASRRG